MNNRTAQKRIGVAALAIFSAGMIYIASRINGTCEEGDSLMHYFFARYAPSHPDFYFNHWAKPFYVLVMSPIAHFGYRATEIFNTILSCVSLWFTYLIARELRSSWAVFVFVIAVFFRLFVIVAFTGLTEPLADLVLSICLYFLFIRKYAVAVLIISFLPFVRSEGIFISALLGLYLVFLKQWKPLPLLLVGHLVYALAGYYYHRDILWVITQIPYIQKDAPNFGHGDWLYFVRQMPAIAGRPNCILLCLGLVLILISSAHFFYKGYNQDNARQKFFLACIFIVFFLMHTTFWALGIFGSEGVIRVFGAIGCVMILIILSAIESIDYFLSKSMRWHTCTVAGGIVGVYILAISCRLHYSDNKFDFGLHMNMINGDRMATDQMADFILQNYPDYKQYHLFLDALPLAEMLDIDIFDANQCRFRDSEHLPMGVLYPDKSMIIWDDSYSYMEQKISLNSLRRNVAISEICSFQKPNPFGGTTMTVLFLSKK